MATTARLRTAILPAGSYLEWSPVIAGAIGAAAISFLLLTFGASIGLTLTSPWPGSGVSVYATVLAVAWWAVLVQIGSYFAGGYLAGRMRSRWRDGSVNESQFRDSTHGFMVWAVGVILSALVVAWTGSGVVKTATQATSTIAAGAASGAGNAMNPGNQAADMLTRSTGPQQGTDSAFRDETRRIFSTSIANGEITAADRSYLIDAVAARNNVPRDEAQRRVDASIQQAQQLEIKARATADKARKATLVAGFLTAATLLISLAAAIFGAAIGGRHRDRGTMANLFGVRFW